MMSQSVTIDISLLDNGLEPERYNKNFFKGEPYKVDNHFIVHLVLLSEDISTRMEVHLSMLEAGFEPAFCSSTELTYGFPPNSYSYKSASPCTSEDVAGVADDVICSSEAYMYKLHVAQVVDTAARAVVG